MPQDLPGSLDVIRHVPGLLVLSKASGVLTEDVLLDAGGRVAGAAVLVTGGFWWLPWWPCYGCHSWVPWLRATQPDVPASLQAWTQPQVGWELETTEVYCKWLIHTDTISIVGFEIKPWQIDQVYLTSCNMLGTLPVRYPCYSCSFIGFDAAVPLFFTIGWAQEK